MLLLCCFELIQELPSNPAILSHDKVYMHQRWKCNQYDIPCDDLGYGCSQHCPSYFPPNSNKREGEVDSLYILYNTDFQREIFLFLLNMFSDTIDYIFRKLRIFFLDVLWYLFCEWFRFNIRFFIYRDFCAILLLIHWLNIYIYV